jgi:predicted DNA-binding transcriptional regulator AlpA
MATTLTPTQRERRDAEIYRLHDRLLSEREIAKLVGCSRSTVWSVLQRRKAVA